MKAVLMTQAGGPEVLQYLDTPAPAPPQGSELLIRLKAAGVNPIDTKLRKRGTFYPEQMPAILGCDGAGIVEATGPQARKFQMGDEVYFCNGGLGGHPGNYAEWAIVAEAFVSPRPKTLSFEQAAAAPLVLITAWEALYDRARLQAGQRVLIHGGAGGVGHVAIQLAKLQGAEVCTTVGSPDKAELARSFGADHVILYKQTDFVQAVLEWTEGEGVDVAFDTVGGATLSQSFAAVRYYGDVVTILEPTPDTDWKTARTRNLRFGFELMLTPMLKGLVDEQHQQAQILEHCTGLIDTRQLQIYLDRTFPLAEAAAAHRLLEAGGRIGKMALMI
ncbi:MAG: zinc-dependent alcohol dehydrogenase family protein [Leptolyngbyaceae cyanobacterium bins.59]|nr:zinc-dependent alcohol dehydrogenase family protein [Leptolyngbyaceae cyanobacterium bins.59]